MKFYEENNFRIISLKYIRDDISAEKILKFLEDPETKLDSFYIEDEILKSMENEEKNVEENSKEIEPNLTD